MIRKKFNKRVKHVFTDRPETLKESEYELYNNCINELMAECERMTGYSKCSCRILEAQSDTSLCIIIERADGIVYG